MEIIFACHGKTGRTVSSEFRQFLCGALRLVHLPPISLLQSLVPHSVVRFCLDLPFTRRVCFVSYLLLVS